MKKNKPSSESSPAITTLGLHKVENNLWTVVTLTVKDGEVIDSKVTQPNMREIAIAELKIAVMKDLIDATAN